MSDKPLPLFESLAAVFGMAKQEEAAAAAAA